MAAVDVLAVIVTFAAGMIAGAIVLVSVASRRENRRQRLGVEARDRLTLAGRYLTRLYVRRTSAEQAPYRDCRDQAEPDKSSRQRRRPT